MSMKRLLQAVSNTGNFLPRNGTPYSRKELTEYIKEKYPEVAHLLQEAWKRGLIRQGLMYGFVLTNKGYNELDNDT